MAKKMWGGRFGKKTDPLVEDFTRSIQYDYKLAKFDLLGSMAHVQVLKKAGYLTAAEASRLARALDSVYASVDKGTFRPDPQSEDIHTAIENLVHRKVGDLALKLHTARSRNEQVSFATKCLCKTATGGILEDISKLTGAIETLAAREKSVIIPGFTHLQHGQVVYLGDHLSAYAQMLKRDAQRLADVSKNIKLTMGAGALAGTPINAKLYKAKLRGFAIDAVTNPLDSVSDRDFVIESLSALSILGMHLSRLAEDLIIWSTREFGFVEIDESFCTGSSLMPQKKNPDVLELTRGYVGRLCGNLVSVLVMMKGLPLGYNRDMQLDKEPLFDSLELVARELKVLTGLIGSLEFDHEKIREALKDESLYATDLVYYLVGKKVPFREAHAVVGRLVKHAADNGIRIKDMPEKLLKTFSDRFVKRDVIKLLDPEVSARSKRSVKRRYARIQI